MDFAQTQEIDCRPAMGSSLVTRRLMALAVGAASLAMVPTAVQAAGAFAGTDIVNVVPASHGAPEGGTPVAIDSNIATITDAALLNVTLTKSATIIDPCGGAQSVPWTGNPSPRRSTRIGRAIRHHHSSSHHRLFPIGV